MAQQHPITLVGHLAYPVMGSGENQTQVLLCSLKAYDLELTQRAPLTLMLCLDTSGSMMGRPLELVAESIAMLLSKLDSRDRLGMVTFNNRARLISPLRAVNEEGRAFYQGVLRGIQALGSTNMSAGLQLALEHLTRDSEGLSHLLLFSDGQPNRGEIDTEELQSIVGKADTRCSVSCLGFSAKHDEDLLYTLARTGRGGYAYIESAETIPIAFAKELGGMLSIVGNHIQLLLRPRAGCSILGLRNDVNLKYTGQGLMVELPDMLGGAQYHLFVDVQVEAPESHGVRPLVEFELRYILPGTHPQQVSLTHQVEYTVAEQPSGEMNPIVSTRLLLYEVAAAWEKAHMLANSNKFSEAIQLLTEQQSRLRAAPGFREEKGDIRNWFEQMVDEIAVLSEYPRGERYQHIRKVAMSEMPDPSGLMRRGSTSIVELNTTQRSLLGELMLKAVGMPHAYLQIEFVPDDSELEVGHVFPILGEASIGRMGEIIIDHHSIGKRHVRLVATPKGYIVIDLLSINPPSINGEVMLHPTLLSDEDMIHIGDFFLSFHMGLAPELQRSLQF